jgi:hypothetical protein
MRPLSSAKDGARILRRRRRYGRREEEKELIKEIIENMSKCQEIVKIMCQELLPFLLILLEKKKGIK